MKYIFIYIHSMLSVIRNDSVPTETNRERTTENYVHIYIYHNKITN
jgi:hypothetical protein